MIAIPLTKKISWRNPPIATVALIIVNIVVFFTIQNNDHDYYLKAQKYYFDSGLDKIEIPLYIDHLETTKPEAYKKINQTKIDKNVRQRVMLYSELNFDLDFLTQLKSDRLTISNTEQKERHSELREEYERLEKKIVYLNYGFRPARPRAETWLTSMFLHGGIGHLIGNMLFLWLIGCMIEYGCRRPLFLAIYGLGGLAATGFFWLLNSNSLIPAIGASGAISGIMGAFTVLYGFKRVRIFLSLGFYFNYLKFPAIILLPLWIGNEVFQMVFNNDSPVAYAAHLGGLMGGAAIAYAARNLGSLINPEEFDDAQEDPVQLMVENALEHMGKLEYSEARELLVLADTRQPGDEAILKHLFTIDRQEPNTPQFHQTCQKLLTVLCRQPDNYPLAHKVFQEYIKLARPAKLGKSLYLSLCRAFCDIGKVEDAHRLAMVLAKKRLNLKGLPSLLIKLARSHAIKGDRKSEQACLECVCDQYPLSSEARIAKRQLNPELSS